MTVELSILLLQGNHPLSIPFQGWAYKVGGLSIREGYVARAESTSFRCLFVLLVHIGTVIPGPLFIFKGGREMPSQAGLPRGCF